MRHTLVLRFWHIGYLMPFFSLGILLYLWSNTSPSTIGPIGMLGVFILLYIFWLSILLIVLRFVSLALKKGKLAVFLVEKKEGRPFHWQLAYYIASIIAFAPVLILAMQSVNQLNIKDMLLVFIFIALAIFYVVKRA